VERLLANAAKLAASDMRWAIETLMGRETGVWTRVVRASTAALIAEMTDPPGEAERPFARDLFFPRLSTCKALKALQSGPTFTVIEGAPVRGKTCLLRELALRTADSDELPLALRRFLERPEVRVRSRSGIRQCRHAGAGAQAAVVRERLHLTGHTAVVRQRLHVRVHQRLALTGFAAFGFGCTLQRKLFMGHQEPAL
jgi:hypothetical protein